jgi:hypothetical protein
MYTGVGEKWQQLAKGGANVHKVKSQVVAEVLAQPLQVPSLEASFPVESKTGCNRRGLVST